MNPPTMITITRSNAARKLVPTSPAVNSDDGDQTTSTSNESYEDNALLYVPPLEILPSPSTANPKMRRTFKQHFTNLKQRIKVPQDGDLLWVPKASIFPTLNKHQQVPLKSLPTVEEVFGNCDSFRCGLEDENEDREEDQHQLEQPEEEVFDHKNNFRRCLTDMLTGRSGTQHQYVAFITTSQCEELRNAMDQDYQQVLLEQTAVEGNENALKQAATHCIDEFLASLPIIHATAMPSTTLEIVFEVMEDFVYPHASYSYTSLYDPEGSDDLTPADAAVAATWINSFVHVLKTTCPDLVLRSEWAEDEYMLIKHYVEKGVRSEMKDVLSRALELHSDDDLRQDPSGFLVTGFPEQVGFMFHQQLTVAKETLPSKYQEDVLVACNEELANCVGEMALKISSNWKDTQSSYFCALINDASILSDQCDARNDLMLQSAKAETAGDAVVRDLTELSLHATRFLCERILHDLREAERILTSVGTVAWEKPEGSHAATERVVATLEDYFADLEVWIMSSDYYFPKVLRTCLDLTLETYLQSFFVNTMANGVLDPATVADNLADDYVNLVAFFNGTGCEKYHGTAGFYNQLQVNDRLRVLQSLAVLVDPATRPQDAKNDIKTVLSEFHSGGQSSAIVLHLGGLRKRHRGQESVEWVETIARAKKELDDESSSDEEGDTPPRSSPTASYNVPDLRQSKFVNNIRPNKLEVSKQISAGTMQYATSTLKLLK